VQEELGWENIDISVQEILFTAHPC